MSESSVLIHKKHSGWFNDTERLLYKWYLEGKLILPDDYIKDDGFCSIYYIAWLFDLKIPGVIIDFYKKLNSGELDIEWIRGSHAYAIYRVLVLKKLGEENV